ncbi:MAG TPA: L,D-transpeptidase family protein [Gemmatimonadaceae bacterium]|nr:L,D-transpeptidase family protein [Gemmatimonadaceae bacterium]
MKQFGVPDRTRLLMALVAVAVTAFATVGFVHHQHSSADSSVVPKKPQAQDSLASAISSLLRGSKPAELRADEWKLVARLYQSEGGASAPAPLWVRDSELLPRAQELVTVLSAADSLGLAPNDYAIGDVRRKIEAASKGTSTRAAALAAAELQLTASLVALLDDLLTGRVDPRSVERGWHIATNRSVAAERILSAVAALRGGKALDAVLNELRPDYGVYSPLVQGLARYRTIAGKGGWPRVPETQVLRVGDSAAAIGALRTRLASEGYLPSANGSNLFDIEVAESIAAFQRRHGLTLDSVLGPQTRKALNVPVESRIDQIDANLERLRWLPASLGSRFVVVNIPAFSLYGYVDGDRVLTMRVVVGDELVSRRTPIFADTMEYVEFGPYWNVPRSIAVNEILPKVRRDRGYLARNGFQMLRGWGDNAPAVDPSTLSDAALFSTRYRLRQLPGPNNALGRVKFMFPNDYNIYLHDTPSKLLFDEADRAHSHGCVRVADPPALAEFVLHDRADWPADRTRTALAAGRRVQVKVRPAIPVYLVYLTAFMRDGEVAFRDDIYNRDDSLIRALRRGARASTMANRGGN